jgi:DNA replication and repair protein RecF
LTLVTGAAAERRHFLDRVLSLADRSYLRSLRRYRAALEQRNAGLRQRRADLARAFEPQLAEAGAELVRCRRAWVAEIAEEWVATCVELGEAERVSLGIKGQAELAEPAAWPAALRAARSRDEATGSTSVGPHREDLLLSLDGSPLRMRGSTGQQRTAAVALKLCEHSTLSRRTGCRPALLLDDVFAELDQDRQDRLARMLGVGAGQVFVTAPRADELPDGLGLPVFAIRAGAVLRESGRAVA